MVELLDWANERPLFTVNEAERLTRMARPSLREKLSRLTARGKLVRVERGKYTVHDDPMVYATYVETPSFISLWSGLRFYDLTTQQPTTLQVLSPVNRGDLPHVDFHTTSDVFGFGKRRYDRFDIFVADPERLLLDCLSRAQVPVSEVIDLVETVEVDTAVAYAERFGRKAVTKRLGYLFDVVRDIDVPALHVDDRNYPRLDLTRPTSIDTNAAWRLNVNADVG